MERKNISIEEFNDGFQFSVTSGWQEVTWQDEGWTVGLGLASSYMKCENDTCGGTPYHFPPKWETYGEHDDKHTIKFEMSAEMYDKVKESSQRRAKEQIFPDIIKKYRKERDEAQVS